jgi:5-methylcytosine-specific restriction protein A
MLDPCRLKVLDVNPSATPRIRGRKWMALRDQALVSGLFTCVDCGRVSTDNEIDHDVPLEQGGSNEASNFRVRCKECHKAKTAREATARARGW